ncbi:MAG: adenylate kinase [Rhabdochlamydiaceae bacterium]|nr:adenylate kinase [Candidatus Amphrikana amoebophyrae]
MSKKIIILLGPPGSGKGSQAALIEQKLHYPHISTGDLLRAEMKAKTPLGLEAMSYVNEGKLGPDSLIFNIITKRIAQDDCKEGFILDGFPRNIKQGEYFQEKLNIDGNDVIVLNFELPDATIIERLSGRLICKDCGHPFHIKFTPPKKEGKCDKCGGELYQRADDAKEVIQHRLQVYAKQTEPLIQFYDDLQILKTIDCSPTPQLIFKQIVKKIG